MPQPQTPSSAWPAPRAEDRTPPPAPLCDRAPRPAPLSDRTPPRAPARLRSHARITPLERGDGAGDRAPKAWSPAQLRAAYRLLPGFDLLPASLLASLAQYAAYFDDRGPLLAAEREELARAVTGRTARSFGARGGDEPPEERARRRLVRRLATRALEPFAPLEADVAALIDEGLPPRAVARVLHALLAFRFLASLGAAMLLRPPQDGVPVA